MEETVSLGGFWARFLAAFIDGLIVGIPSWAMGFMVGMLKDVGVGLGTRLLLMLIQWMISILIQVGYYGYFYTQQGATPGKQLLGLMVLDHETRQFLTFGQTLLRELIGKPVSWITVIGYPMAAFRRDKRALHDLIAGTQVIRHRGSYARVSA